MRRSGNSTTETTVSSPAVKLTLNVPVDDGELLRRTGHGEEEAFRELVQRHSRYLYGIATALTGNAADAEDVVQETFVAVLNSKFRGESAVRTWLVQILVRRAAMLRRSRRRAPTAVEPGTVIEGFAAPASGAGPSAVDARTDLAVMLEHLSSEHRQVIVLREIEGMSYDEMAAALCVPRGTVESRLHRARNELRERFKGYLQKP